MRVVERDCQPREQARAQRAAVGRQAAQGLLEDGHEVVVDDPGGEPEAAEAERGARQEVGVLHAAGEVDRGQQGGAGGVAAGLHLRLAAVQEQLAAAAVVVLAEHVERGERRVEEVGGALVGQGGQRLAPGALGVLEGLGRVAHRRRLDEVVRELGGAGRRALERLAHRGVQPGAARGREVAVEGLADEAVGEAEAPGRAGRLLDELHGEGLVELLEQVRPSDARGALEDGEAEVAALHGTDLECLADLGAQRQQAPADGIAHAVGERDALAQRQVDEPLRHEQAHDLVGVEGVALGERAQRVHELLGGVGAAAVDDERAQVVVLEAAEVDALPEAAELAEHGLELGPAPGPGLVMRGHDEDARVAQRSGQEGEQQQRRQVGGVEVVEQRHQRLARGRVAQEDGDRVEEREARLLGLEVAGLGKVEALAQLGSQLCDPAGPDAEVGAQLVVVALGGHRAHDLDPGPEGGGATAVPPARRRDAMPAHRGVLAERRRQPRLADARLAGDEDESAASRGGLLEGTLKVGQLVRAAEERELGRRRGGVGVLAHCIPHSGHSTPRESGMPPRYGSLLYGR